MEVRFFATLPRHSSQRRGSTQVGMGTGQQQEARRIQLCHTRARQREIRSIENASWTDRGTVTTVGTHSGHDYGFHEPYQDAVPDVGSIKPGRRHERRGSDNGSEHDVRISISSSFGVLNCLLAPLSALFIPGCQFLDLDLWKAISRDYSRVG